MEKIFETVQSQFMQLSTLLTELDFEEDRAKPYVLAKLNDTISSTYVLLNEGFCESATMCEKCVEYRDQLRTLSELMDISEENNKISEEAYSALLAFSENIPMILSKMQSVKSEAL